MTGVQTCALPISIMGTRIAVEVWQDNPASAEAAIDAVIDNRFFNHLSYGERFPSVALAILRLKPIKTAVGIIEVLLFREEQRKAIAICKRRPSSPKIVARGGLCTPMQHNDECGLLGKYRRPIGEHSQVAGVRSEGKDFLQSWEEALGSATTALQEIVDQPTPSGRFVADTDGHRL